MRRLIIPVACFALLFASTAFAGSATGLLYKDGTTVNILEDADYESIIDIFDSDGVPYSDNNPRPDEPTLDVGDRLFGIYEIERVSPDPILGRPDNVPTTNAFTAVFYVVVTGKTGNDTDGYDWTFGAVAPGDWATLGFTGLQATSGTIALIYDDNVLDGTTSWIDPDAAGGVLAALATVNGTRLWEVGFAGVAGEYWAADGPSDNLLDYADGPASDGVAQDDLEFGANLNVTWDYGTGITLLPHDYLFRGLGLHQWQLKGSGEALDPGNFDLGTDSNLYIVATPEPASIALLGLGLLGVGGVVYRRRRRA